MRVEQMLHHMVGVSGVTIVCITQCRRPMHHLHNGPPPIQWICENLGGGCGNTLIAINI